MAENKTYVYLKLRDALSANIGSVVNVWGCVNRIEPPRATRGTDFLMSTWLIDSSTDLGTAAEMQGVEVRFWAAEKIYVTATPTTAKLGDIIRIHRATVREYEGRRFLEVKVANNALGQAWLSFTSAVNGSEEPYAKSCRTFTFVETDRLRLRALREYLVQREQLGVAVGAPVNRAGQEQVAAALNTGDKYLRQIMQLDPKLTPFADVICRVMGVDRRSGLPVAFVWDGTDAIPHPASFSTVTPEALGHALTRYEMPLRALPNCQVLEPNYHIPAMGVLCPLLDPYSRLHGQQGPFVGSWIRLRNVAVSVVLGQTQIVYTRNSQWKALPPGDATVESTASMYETMIRPRRLVAGHACWHMEQWVTRTLFRADQLTGALPEVLEASYNFPLSTLREVGQHCHVNDRRPEAEQQGFIHFASLVRCAEVLSPLTPEGILKPVQQLAGAMVGGQGGEAAARALTAVPSHVFSIELLLEDGTGRAPVRLCSPHADALLGVTAQQAARDEGAARHAIRVLGMLRDGFSDEFIQQELLPGARQWIGSESPAGPWMEVGLKAVKSRVVDPITREMRPQWNYLVVQTKFSETALRTDKLRVTTGAGEVA